MKDFSQSELEEGMPEDSAMDLIDFSLSALYGDKKHNLTEEFVKGLSFEELIGALRKAQYEIIVLEKENSELSNLLEDVNP